MLCAIALVANISVAALAQSAVPEKEIVASIYAYFDAFARLDADAMAAIETDDYVFIQDGRIVDKQQQIASIRDARKKLGTTAPPPRKYAIEVHRISRAGDRFVVTGTNTVTAEGTAFKAAFTEVWLQQGGRWRVQHGHYSGPPPSAGQKPAN